MQNYLIKHLMKKKIIIMKIILRKDHNQLKEKELKTLQKKLIKIPVIKRKYQNEKRWITVPKKIKIIIVK